MRLFNIMETAFENFDSTINNYITKVCSDLGIRQGNTQIFSLIFKGIKGVMQNAMFYIEDSLTEQNILTASRKKSVYSLARLSGFEPSYGTTACGTLIGTLKLNNETEKSKLYISNNAEIINKATGIKYLIQLPNDYYVFDISKALMTHEFKIIEGSLIRNSYMAIGEPLETVHITSFGKYDRNYLEVFVNGIKYNQVGNLYEMSEDSKDFVCNTGFDNTFDIMFGNGTFGKRLREGDSVTIKYLIHNGSLGNVASNAVCEFKFVNGVSDSSGNSVDGNTYISLNLYNCISGGTDEDDIALVRAMTGYNSRSNVIMNENNFKLFFKRFSFVGNSNIWVENNSMVVNAAILRNVDDEIKSVEDYINLPDDKFLLNKNEIEMLENTLNNSNKTFAGITLNIINPEIRKFAMICYVKCDIKYNKDVLKDNIKNTIVTYFMNLDVNNNFISKSLIIKHVLDNVENIDVFDFDFISELAEKCYVNGYYDEYDLRLINNEYTYVKKKVFFENDKTPGLDDFGNINLKSKIEIPLLRGGFNYYPDKNSGKDKSIRINDPVEIYFIE